MNDCKILSLSNKNIYNLYPQEILSIKLYSDQTKLCSLFRKTFWDTNDEKLNENKSEMYQWAKKLYNTLNYVKQPIYKNLYHGLNKVFSIENTLPKFNAPISTTTSEEVSRTFCNGKGLIWTIKNDYRDFFHVNYGFYIKWISKFSHEEEVLLMNSYLPIYETEITNKKKKVKKNYIIQNLIKTKNKITNAKKFLKQYGISKKELLSLSNEELKMRTNYKHFNIKKRIYCELCINIKNYEYIYGFKFRNSTHLVLLFNNEFGIFE